LSSAVSVAAFREWLASKELSPLTVNLYAARVASLIKSFSTTPEDPDFLEKITSEQQLKRAISKLSASYASFVGTAWSHYAAFVREILSVEIPTTKRLYRAGGAPDLYVEIRSRRIEIQPTGLPEDLERALGTILREQPTMPLELFAAVEWGHLVRTPTSITLMHPGIAQGPSWTWRLPSPAWAELEKLGQPRVCPCSLAQLHKLKRQVEENLVPLYLPPPGVEEPPLGPPPALPPGFEPPEDDW
jgi:hypothetical protein